MARVQQSPPEARPPSLLVSVAEAARLLGISETLAYEMVATGELKTVVTTRRRKLIPRSEVERFASLDGNGHIHLTREEWVREHGQVLGQDTHDKEHREAAAR